MFSEKKRTKENSALFKKFSCFCECHLLHLFRKITCIIFQAQSLFSLSVTHFFPIQWKNPSQFYSVFSPSCPLHNSSFCPVESSKNHWSIDNSFSFARHISFLLIISKSCFLGGNLFLFTIRMVLFELKIPSHEISLLRCNEQC